MCRLAYFPRRARPSWVPAWLRQLEESCGGHGNGFAAAGRVRKGVGVTVEEVARLLDAEPGPAAFHTRLVSSGPKCDSLCHPFRAGEGWLMHNGHWADGATAATIWSAADGKAWSDTRVAAALVHRLGFREFCERFRPRGTWIWMPDEGRVRVYVNGGSLWRHSSGILGSEPADGTDRDEWYRVADGYWGGRGLPPRAEPKRATALAVGPVGAGYRSNRFVEEWDWAGSRAASRGCGFDGEGRN